MNVVRHYDIVVQLVMLQIPIMVMNRRYYHICNLGVAQVQRTGTRTVENSVQCEKRSSRRRRRREDAASRKTAVQPPGEKCRMADGVIVRQAADVEGGHYTRSVNFAENSQADC